MTEPTITPLGYDKAAAFTGTLKATVDIEMTFSDFFDVPPQSELDTAVSEQIKGVIVWALHTTQLGLAGAKVNVDKLSFLPLDVVK